MWLDRLAGVPERASGPSTPQGGSRPFTPVPRRTSSNLSPYTTSQRPGHSPRVSQLSLVSNDSASSLLSASRKPNGSGLKQSSTVDPSRDSLEVLEKLLANISSRDTPSTNKSGPIELEDLEFDCDFGGLSLKELAAEEAPESLGPRPQQPQRLEDSRTPGSLYVDPAQR
jgi:vacuolar protein sorting-associated protein 52